MVNRMKIVCCQRHNCSPLNVLFSDVQTIDYVDIAWRSSDMSQQSEYSGQEYRFLTSTRENMSQTVNNTAAVTTKHQQEIAYR